MLWLILIPVIVLIGLVYIYSLVKPLRQSPQQVQSPTENPAESQFRDCKDMDDE